MAVNLDIFAPQMSRVAEGLEGKVILVYGGNNLGKAQPVNTMIPTPDGLKRLGDLQVGDAVFDRSGKITKVLEIYEQGLKDNYKVTLADGRTTYCNDEHLWTYYTSRNNLKTLTLKDMVDRGIEKGAGYRFQIPMNNKVNYPEKEYDVDPYVVGCFIGDGCTTMTALTISSPDEEIVNEIVKLIGAKKAKKCSDKNYSWNFEMFEKDYYTSGSNTVINFQTKNLFKNCEEMIGTADKKRIPQKYLFGSIEQRLSLLQGLMDTDGTINAKDFNCRYDTVHFDLAKDVVFLLNSLGISATINSYVRDEKNVCYYININTPNENKHNLFRMSRKKEKALEAITVKKDKYYDRISIVNVEKMPEQEEMRCIYVDNEEHLYLTNDFIVTHNTKQATRMKKPFYLPFENGLNAIDGVPYCPINSWSDFIRINNQLTSPKTVEKAKELYSTIIFDEVDAASKYCQDFVCAKYSATSIGEGNGGYGLWKEYATEFWKQINKLVGAGYCVYFIAHAQEKEGFVSPKADSRALSPIVDNTDLCVYLKSNGVDEDGRVVKSSAYLAQTDEFFARSRFDYIDTYIETFTAETLEKAVVDAINRQKEAEGITTVTFAEQKSQKTSVKKTYEELMQELQEMGEAYAESGQFEELTRIVEQTLGQGKKASDLKKGQEQVIEVLLDALRDFAGELSME